METIRGNRNLQNNIDNSTNKRDRERERERERWVEYFDCIPKRTISIKECRAKGLKRQERRPNQAELSTLVDDTVAVGGLGTRSNRSKTTRTSRSDTLRAKRRINVVCGRRDGPSETSCRVVVLGAAESAGIQHQPASWRVPWASTSDWWPPSTSTISWCAACATAP